MILACIVSAAIPLYATYVYISYNRDVAYAAILEVPSDVRNRYDKTAETFDSDVDLMEKLGGINRLRKRLCQKATGHVLEASVGTGRNMKYYPLPKGKIKTVTMVDTSSEMIRVARSKWGKTNAWFINAIFRIQDAANPVPCPGPNGFDTVVQTMGICSTPDPERLLRNLGNKTNQDGGRILLLEHGRSHYKWLNDVLDKIAPAHANRHGCWFNKDIGKIVERSGLEVVAAKRYHFGTLWWFELTPPKRPQIVDVTPTKEIVVAEPQRPWWSWRWN